MYFFHFLRKKEEVFPFFLLSIEIYAYLLFFILYVNVFVSRLRIERVFPSPNSMAVKIPSHPHPTARSNFPFLFSFFTTIFFLLFSFIPKNTIRIEKNFCYLWNGETLKIGDAQRFFVLTGEYAISFFSFFFHIRNFYFCCSVFFVE